MSIFLSIAHLLLCHSLSTHSTYAAVGRALNEVTCFASRQPVRIVFYESSGTNQMEPFSSVVHISVSSPIASSHQHANETGQ